MDKEYKLKTIEEILSVVNIKNVENFKKDFCDWLDFKMSLQEINKKDLPFAVEIDKTTFNWTDDGKADVNIKITFN